MATRKSVADDLHDENSAAYQRGMAELHKQLGPMAMPTSNGSSGWRLSSPG